MRADNYGLSEEMKRLRDSEQARLTEHAYEEAQRLLTKHRRPLDRVAQALLEKETLVREELNVLLVDVAPESSASETIGTVRVLPARHREELESNEPSARSVAASRHSDSSSK